MTRESQGSKHIASRKRTGPGHRIAAAEAPQRPRLLFELGGLGKWSQRTDMADERAARPARAVAAWAAEEAGRLSDRRARVLRMGIFKRRFRNRVAEPSPVVTVAFRDLATKAPLANFSADHGYAYLWPFPETPRVGDWAVAPGLDGPALVVVGSLGLPASARGETLKPLLKRVPAEAVARVRA